MPLGTSDFILYRVSGISHNQALHPVPSWICSWQYRVQLLVHVLYWYPRCVYL